MSDNQNNTPQPASVEGVAEELPISVLLVTQNVGSIECSGCKDGVTENVTTMTQGWLHTFAHFLDNHTMQNGRSGPDVLVVHVQEIGGKKYNAHFNKYLSSQVHKLWPDAGWCSGLLMAAQNDDTTFTAMGTVIFVSPRLVPVTSLLSIKHRVYVAVADDPITYTGSSNFLFHGAKFSNAEKSRKGFLLSSIRVGHTVMNFLNLHMFHDADNSVAVAESPSKYCPKRCEAFLEAMAEISPVIQMEDPLFIFGDFNTRLDGYQLTKYLKETLKVDNITMGKKDIEAPDAVWDFLNNASNQHKLTEFDLEATKIIDQTSAQYSIDLAEFPINFMPTYLYDDRETSSMSEPDLEALDARVFKKERLPAFCDRIWFNAPALGTITKKPVSKGSGSLGKALAGASKTTYNYETASMHAMDHKAVFLQFELN